MNVSYATHAGPAGPAEPRGPQWHFKLNLNFKLAECYQSKSESLAREPTARKGHVTCHLAASPALRAARRIGGHGPGVSCQCLLNRDVTVTVTGT